MDSSFIFVMDNSYTFNIIHEGDHYVVYVDGKFYATADNYTEAVYEVEQALKEKKENAKI